jgi:hypothetical protein
VINHARTLLLNSTTAKRPGINFPGEEIVPASFIPVKQTAAVKTFRDALFGTSPDNLFLNYRLNQLLRTVHSTDYADYITSLDNRITYELTGSEPFGRFQFGVTGRSLHITNPTLTASGVFHPANELGRAEERWVIEITDIGGARATIQNLRTQNTITQSITLNNGLSSPIPLEDTGITVQVKFVGVETKILVIAQGRPSDDLASLATHIEKYVGHVEGELFGFAPVEPYVTFFGLWKYANALPDRIAGLVLALVYRMDELRVS